MPQEYCDRNYNGYNGRYDRPDASDLFAILLGMRCSVTQTATTTVIVAGIAGAMTTNGTGSVSATATRTSTCAATGIVTALAAIGATAVAKTGAATTGATDTAFRQTPGCRRPPGV